MNITGTAIALHITTNEESRTRQYESRRQRSLQTTEREHGNREIPTGKRPVTTVLSLSLSTPPSVMTTASPIGVTLPFSALSFSFFWVLVEHNRTKKNSTEQKERKKKNKKKQKKKKGGWKDKKIMRINIFSFFFIFVGEMFRQERNGIENCGGFFSVSLKFLFSFYFIFFAGKRKGRSI